MFHQPLKKTLLERIRLSVAAMLPDDWQHEVRFHEVADRMTMVVETITWGREIVTEGETVTIPASAWDAVKEAMNRYLGAIDRWYQNEGLRPVPWRFRVQGKQIRVKQVHHVCPHIGGDWEGHIRYLLVPENRNAHEHRVMERIRYLVGQPLNQYESGEARFHEIQHHFRGLR